MKKQYEAPEMSIDWFLTQDILAVSNPTDWIPDTDDDDPFGDL